MSFVEDLRGFISGFGEEIVKDSFSYSLTRDLFDSRYKNTRSINSPGKFSGLFLEDGAVKAAYGDVSLKVKEYEGNIYEFNWYDGPEMPVEILNESGGFTIQDNKAVSAGISIEFSDSGILIRDKDGMEIEKSKVEVSGGFIKHSYNIYKNEHLYGTGERALPLDLKGHACRLWNHDANGSYGPDSDPLYLNVPIILHALNGKFFLRFYANAGDGYIDAGYSNEDSVLVSFRSPPLKYYLITGSLNEIYSALSKITGKPYMPPLWSFG
ncbi:MAG: glycoside hydrolase family 31 protein, partial [Thermoplasmata archaeon]